MTLCSCCIGSRGWRMTSGNGARPWSGGTRDCDQATSFSAHVMENRAPLVVPDAMTHPKLQRHPPRHVFNCHVGCPIIRAGTGHCLGGRPSQFRGERRHAGEFGKRSDGQGSALRARGICKAVASSSASPARPTQHGMATIFGADGNDSDDNVKDAESEEVPSSVPN